MDSYFLPHHRFSHGTSKFGRFVLVAIMVFIALNDPKAQTKSSDLEIILADNCHECHE
jgi:hypothetical protein